MLKLMLKGLLLVLLFTNCKTRTPKEYFGRKDFMECITLERKGYMACNGRVYEIPAGLIVPKEAADYFEAKEYCEKREYGHFICLEYPSRCSANPSLD